MIFSCGDIRTTRSNVFYLKKWYTISYGVYFFCLNVFIIPGTSWWELQSRCRRCWACWWCSGWLEKLFSDICTESDWCSQRLSCWWWRWRISLDPPWSPVLTILIQQLTTRYVLLESNLCDRFSHCDSWCNWCLHLWCWLMDKSNWVISDSCTLFICSVK